MKDALDQFVIHKVLGLEVAGLDLSVTNLTISLLTVLVLLALFFTVALRNVNTINKPIGRLHAAFELIYDLVYGMLEVQSHPRAKRFLPLIFTLFTFLLVSNLLGMIPGFFTATSHISITFFLAGSLFLLITFVGFVIHGTKFLSLFLPKGVPFYIAPLIILVELFAYLARPVSLSIRLAANMTAGHIVLKVLVGFIALSGFFGIFPFALLTLLIGFEIFVAVLQAYIFAVLVCVYLNEAINLH